MNKTCKVLNFSWLFFLLKDEEVGLDIDDFLEAEEIDLDHEIPEDKEDPIEEAHEDGNMYEGDMDLTEEQIALLEGGDRAAIMEMRQVMLRNHWPRVGDHMIIPYTINANQFDKSERKNIARAFEEYEKQTCIRYDKFSSNRFSQKKNVVYQ